MRAKSWRLATARSHSVEHRPGAARPGRAAMDRAASTSAIACRRKTCERVRMSMPGNAPPSTRRRRLVRRRRIPRSVCSDPVWTMRNTPSSRGAAEKAKSSGSKPIGMPVTTRGASPGIACRTRAAASGAAITIADALASARRICRRSSARCAALGYRRISSSAHGSSRSATHGFPSASASRAPAQAVSYGAHDATTTSASAPTRRPSSVASSTHHRTQRCDPGRTRARRAAKPVGPGGSLPSTRWTSAAAGMRARSSGSSSSQRPRGCPGPVTTTGS